MGQGGFEPSEDVPARFASRVATSVPAPDGADADFLRPQWSAGLRFRETRAVPESIDPRGAVDLCLTDRKREVTESTYRNHKYNPDTTVACVSRLYPMVRP
jgi:hypothetical protein